jgi:hypothetical protein
VTDGTTTEIKTREGSPIVAGMNVIAGIASPTATASTTTSGSNPFGQSGSQQRGGGGGPRGGF